jgi:ABC-type uncharacterized transport system YnjBCD permease subunit
MMPPIAVAIPIYLMYRELNLTDTHIGMILLYTAVNVSLAVWLLKGFIDEIPREYEEAALVDGYTRLQAFRKVVLPQAVTGIAATAIFCLIFSWNEYAFALLLTSGEAQTMPPFIPFIIGEGGQDWPAVAAATTLFLVPIVFFTIEMATEIAECRAATVITNDDVAVESSTHSTGRRGVAGTLIVEKIVGAAAEKGVDLTACAALGARVNASPIDGGGVDELHRAGRRDADLHAGRG